MNDKYVTFKKAKDLAEYLYTLTFLGAAYMVVNETDGSWSVFITGF